MKISIVIPAYNEEKYIGKTLESIKNLDTKDWDVETLIVDGSSTDKTVQIAKSNGARVISKPRKGIGFARQQGLENVDGEIVVFTDADTTVPKDWLVRHVEALLQPGVVFSYGAFRVIDGAFPYFHFINYLQPHILWWCHYLFRKPIAAGQNLAFWRKKGLSIGGFDINLPVMEDIDFAIRMMKIGKVVFLDDLIVFSSGRRSKEGWGFFLRMTFVLIKYFFLGRESLGGFPHFR